MKTPQVARADENSPTSEEVREASERQYDPDLYEETTLCSPFPRFFRWLFKKKPAEPDSYVEPLPPSYRITMSD